MFHCAITHSADDEGNAYRQHLQRYAELLGGEVLSAEQYVVQACDFGTFNHSLVPQAVLK